MKDFSEWKETIKWLNQNPLPKDIGLSDLAQAYNAGVEECRKATNDSKPIDFELVSRDRMESALPETDCGGKKYEDWEREDIIRYMIFAAEIQRDKDLQVIKN